MVLAAIVMSLLFLNAPRFAHSHGFMSEPPARNSVELGTPSYIGVGGNGGNSNGIKPGVCGDQFDGFSGTPFASRAFQSRRSYAQGGTIDVRLTLSANHGGRHAFRVCNQSIPTESCFGGNWMIADDVQTDAKFGPRPGLRYWYIPWIGGEGSNGETWWTQYYSARFRLPSGFHCASGCLIQWTWWASQGCAQPCEPGLGAQEDETKCGRNRWNNVCNVNVFTWEEFKNCADITVTPSAAVDTPPPPVVVENKTQPMPPRPNQPGSSPPPPAAKAWDGTGVCGRRKTQMDCIKKCMM